MNGIAIFVALVAVLAAVGFFLSARSTRAAAKAREKESGGLRAEAEAARKEAGALRAEAKERREEATSLRAELRDAKKKAFDQAEAAKRLGGATALREEIDKLSARLAEARAEAAHGAERVKALEVQLEKATKEIEKAREAARQTAPRKVEPPPAPPPAAPAVGVETLAAEHERADRAEAKLAESRKRVADLEKEVKTARGRLETEKRVYVVQKGELDLAADRYTELKRRYDALRKDHEELLDAVRQAAREDRRLAEKEKQGETPAGGAKGESAA